MTGVGTLDVVTTADRQPVVASQIAETGELVAMVVVPVSGDPQFGELQVEAGIMTGEEGNLFKSAVLVQSYIYLGRDGFWSGSIEMGTGDRIFIQARAASAMTLRLNWRRVGGE